MCHNSYGQLAKDSAGVYLTKDDFAENKLSYSTPYRLKDKFAGLHSDFGYEARGIILLKQVNKNFLSFEPSKIYGFYSEGKKFLYIPAIKRYLFVLNEEPVTILIGEETNVYYHYASTDLLLFYLNKNNELKRMKTENLNSDFNKESNMLQALEDIQKKFKERKRRGKVKMQEFSKYIKERFIFNKSGN